jgi:hypothetical protein
VKNWRNFQRVSVALRERQFIVGANASGKSNLLDVFRFLRDIAKTEGGGLQKAVKDRGGVSKIRSLVQRGGNTYAVLCAALPGKTTCPPAPNWRGNCGAQHLGIDISQRLGLKGKGYLQSKAPSLNQTAKGFPVFMLTDQDAPGQCPPQLVQTWTKGERNVEFFLRVAVMEVESWVMADRKGFADFLSIPLNRIPEDTDVIPQPKEFLVSLARLSKKTRLR